MNKKILIGSMLVLALILLMPSIPAIQQKTVEEGTKHDLQEKLDTINLDDLKNIEVLDGIKYPIIYALLSFYITIRGEFVVKFIIFVVDFLHLHIESPLFIFLYRWLYLRLDAFRFICQIIADALGWNWNLPEVPPFFS